MKIAIDISQSIYGTGVSEYTKSLVSSLTQIDEKNEYLLFGGSLRRGRDLVSLFPNAKVFPIPPSVGNVIWNTLHVLPIEKLIGTVDVLHTSDWVEPPSRAFKVTTIHDLAPFVYPNLFPRDILRDIVNVHKKKLAWVKQESKRIIVPTEATRGDLLKLGFDENIIRVIPEGVNPIFTKVAAGVVELVKNRYRIHGNYLLAVGMDPRKNTERIIKAFEHAAPGRDIKLIFVGQPKYIKFNATRNIRILGKVDAGDLAALYNGALGLIYPSLYEGFGLPILEAMSCGCPVVTSNLSSMSEVAGNAAILVDPYDTNAITEGIQKVIRGAKIYVEKGYRRVKDFSWNKTATLTLEVYKESNK